MNLSALIVVSSLFGTAMPAEMVSQVHTHEQFSSVSDLIKARLDEKKIPSMAVAVAKGGRIIWEEGFGVADPETGIRATPETMYSLASISKPVTATALMILKERSKIDLDRQINDYLGDAKVTARVGDAAQATVLRVANHTSGLPLHWHFFSETKPPGRDETIRRYGILVTAPGEKYQYSNLGYGILDYLIARVSRKSYSEFLNREVFKPLGMTRASVGVARAFEKFAAPRCTPDGKRLPTYDFDHPGASAVYCSAHDLVRFGMFHLKDHLKDQRPVLSDESIDAMQTPVTNRGVGSGYGIGWAVGRGIRGYKRVEHSGGMPGVSTELLLLPNQDIAIVVLCNTRTEVVDEVANKIVSIVLPEYQTKRSALAAQGQARQEAANKTLSRPVQELRGEWSGQIATYLGTIPIRLDIDDAGSVQVRLGRAPAARASDPKLLGQALTFEFQGNMGTDDTFKSVCDIEMELRQRGDMLNGSATAISRTDGSNGFALTHWVELRRAK